MSWQRLLYDQWQGCDLPAIEDDLRTGDGNMTNFGWDLPGCTLDDIDEATSAREKHPGGRPRLYDYRVGDRVLLGKSPCRVKERHMFDGLPEYRVRSQSGNDFWVREWELSSEPFLPDFPDE